MGQNTENINHFTNLLMITGNGKNVGKTYLACLIIHHFKKQYDVTGIKISPHFHNNQKEYETTGIDFFIEKEKKKDTGKDSAKMLFNGAHEVYYIESSENGLVKNVNRIKEIVEGFPVVCESGILVKSIKPGLIIYIHNQEVLKNQEIKNKADIILDNHSGKVYFDLNKLAFEKGKWKYYR